MKSVEQTTEPDATDHVAFVRLGETLLKLNRLEDAEKVLRQALILKSDYAATYNNLGIVLHNLGRLTEAEKAYRHAVTLQSDFAMAHNNLGAALQNLGRLDEAEREHRRAMALRPDFAEAYNNLGSTLKELGRLDEARNACIRALAIKPGYVEARCNLGVISEELGLFDQAATHFRATLALCPNYAFALWSLALLNLRQGNLQQGWKWYELRLKIEKDSHAQLQVPGFDGAELHGRCILVYAEQGVGEEIMFTSCLREICDATDHCILECDVRLVPLFARSFPAVTVIPQTELDGAPLQQVLPPLDYKLPLGSLPRHFRNAFSDFNGHGPWLTPCRKAVDRWKSRYAALGPGLKVGISWRGGLRAGSSRIRSTELLQWQDVLTTPHVHFVNLQYGDCQKELDNIRDRLGVTIHDWDDADPLRNLDDFAAQVAALDLVISVDNSTVHMAGGLGIPVWCLLAYVPNWRWMLERDDSPWYPGMKLVRQRAHGDWPHLFGRVAQDLNRLSLQHDTAAGA